MNIGDGSFTFTAKVELDPEWAARFKQPPEVEISFDVNGDVPPDVVATTQVEINGIDGARFEQTQPAEPEYDARGKLVRIRATGRFIEARSENPDRFNQVGTGTRPGLPPFGGKGEV